MSSLLSIVACCLALAAPEPKAADLEPTVEAMESAVREGAIPDYLAHVSSADPVFLMEQTNWAKDLAEHRPMAFDLELLGDKLTPQADGSVTVPLTVSWQMSEKDKAREVAFNARFVDHDGRWEFAGQVWMRVEAPGVIVLTDPKFKDEGLHIAAVLPGVRQRVHELLGVEVSAVQQVKVYGNMNSLQESIYLSYTDPLGGWNEPGEAIKLIGRKGQSGRMLRRLLAHEYGHVGSFAFGDKATDMPWWVLEGVAEYCSAEITGGAKANAQRVRQWAQRDRLVEWSKLADFRGEAMNHQARVYEQGHNMVRYIFDHYGPDRARAWLTTLAAGKTLEQASRQGLGSSWAEIDAAWQESLVDH